MSRFKPGDLVWEGHCLNLIVKADAALDEAVLDEDSDGLVAISLWSKPFGAGGNDFHLRRFGIDKGIDTLDNKCTEIIGNLEEAMNKLVDKL